MFGWLSKWKNDPKRLIRDAVGRHELPSFPKNVLDALRHLRDPQAGIGAAADAIAKDPGSTARLLAVVNSPAYGLRHQVKNVHQAASLLGRNQVESLLLAAAARERLRVPETRGHEPARFWRAAARRGALARHLASEIQPATKSESFTASLLQDMAVPLLAHEKGDRYQAILEAWLAGEECLATMERGEFGWDHGAVAGAMADTWSFPRAITAAIGAHHGEEEPDVPIAVRLVADLREDDDPDVVDALVSEAEARFGVPADRTVAMIAKAEDEAAELGRAFAA